MANIFHILGYDTSKQYPKYSKTSVGPFALIKPTSSSAVLKLFFGSSNPTNIYWGSSLVQSIYMGSTKVWQK